MEKKFKAGSLIVIRKNKVTDKKKLLFKKVRIPNYPRYSAFRLYNPDLSLSETDLIHRLYSGQMSAPRICKLSGQLDPNSIPIYSRERVWSRINIDPAKTNTCEPLRVAITGAAGQIAYSLAFLIARGHLLGPYQPVILQLIDVPFMATALKGVTMELQDCAYPLLRDIICSTDPETGFVGANVVVMVGAFPRKAGMQRRDLTAKNCAIFKGQGEAISKYADPDVRVLVVGNPANTNAVVLEAMAKTIPKNHITCMTRLDHNRSKAQIAERIGVQVQSIHNVIIWGNHSSTQYPDLRFAYVSDYPQKGMTMPVNGLIADTEWVQKTFIPTVQQRGAKVIEARQKSSAASAATAACDHVRDWLLGTMPGEIVSMGVFSDGSKYGVRPGLIYSFPVTCSGGEYHVVENLTPDEFSLKMMRASEEELAAERQEAFELLGIPLDN